LLINVGLFIIDVELEGGFCLKFIQYKNCRIRRIGESMKGITAAFIFHKATTRNYVQYFYWFCGFTPFDSGDDGFTREYRISDL